MKLNIGSGRKLIRGYETIDVEAYAKPTYLGDFRTMSFSDVEEIRSYHLLEHFNRKESIEVLKLWHSWLQPGGILNIETPDLERLCQIFTTQPPRLWAQRELVDIALYGSQEADWAYHRAGWYREKFEKILPEIGFKINLIKQNHTNVKHNGVKYRLPNILVIAQKNV